MSHTKRNKPNKKLDEKEEKLVKKGKYHHGVHTKMNPKELEFSEAAKKEAKKLKHKKQRRVSKKTIDEGTKDE